MDGRKIKKYLLVSESDNSYMTGLLGRLNTDLRTFKNNYTGGGVYPVEFAPVLDEGYREFLAGMHYDPPIDITLARDPSEESSIMTSSLDSRLIMEIIQSIVNTSGFKLKYPTNDFMAGMETNFKMEVLTHASLKDLAELLDVKFEKVFGFAKYANLLYRYKGLSKEDSTLEAAVKYGLPTDIITTLTSHEIFH